MAVDNEAKYMNFFRDNNAQLSYNGLIPMYNQNDVVFNQLSPGGKLLPTPAVKDDSGITFNNTFIPTQQPSRKRPRDAISCVAPQLFTVNPVQNPSSTTTSTNTSINLIDNVFLGHDLSLQIMQQDLEFDRLISHHMERMKVEIEERKRQQLRTIMAAMEESLGRRLRHKEEELAKMGRINYALEEKVKSLCLENQIWRDLAQTNEATANALRTNLEQVLEQKKHGVETEVADDAGSCCGSSGNRLFDVDESESKRNDGWIYRGKSGVNCNNNNTNGRLCKKCGEGESSVLLLPCRHLCLCTSCGPAVNTCPICDTVKNASVHVNLSSM